MNSNPFDAETNQDDTNTTFMNKLPIISLLCLWFLFSTCTDKEDPPILEIRDLLDSAHIGESIEKAKVHAERSGKTDQIHYLRGWIQYLRKDDDQAEKEYKLCLKENPDSYDCLRGIGLILQQRKQYAKAESSFQKALSAAEEQKDFEAASILRVDSGNLLLRQNRRSEAILEYKKSLEAKRDGSAYFGLGLTALLQGDRRSSKDYLEKGLKTPYRDLILKAETYYLLAKLQFEWEKNPGAAAVSAKKAFELFPAKKEYAKAWEQYSKAASKLP
ncbi:tetratricopeptide repeat protein [Leptospira inadai serovar Lyme str. 10]|uniref:Tetratricopeptide repeat protein n=2 Tax=Leptospira inadai serovar Lyme TaxID=293084 RepID=V6H9M6_9LEPT|nr:tetratricopeptide repeat protein [Leptospira inadai]EQA34863.1 tetratricopeptide repeat protein [Leptospira inadai serovar Lyme str. 10]